MFHYAPGRAKAHPLNFLAGYRGRFLQCDAYQSYYAMIEIARENGPWQLVYCWTHVRRRFVKRFESDGSPILVFGNAKMTTALLDRLTEAAGVVLSLTCHIS